ncbi:hypothetical protein D9619_008812 [Psilocybe cf. subviscida]|uniref:FAD-binding PCMH-type domain-containing protein n=1 Tax=Psilocybe cf. subviscida TaxID=2480587 RepID=A0A8H5BAH0_9AGAR|nr:hypothetical protein D9619_008812 [Psilocybe cf. subviscida]
MTSLTSYLCANCLKCARQFNPISKSAMLPRDALLLSLSLIFHTLGVISQAQVIDSVCSRISHVISNSSQIFLPGDPTYEKDILHSASSSTQRSKCVVEAGSPSDIAKILAVIRATRSPFAVKGGGHAMNPGFSSTPGVHISMARFSEVTYHAAQQTVDLGAGLIWDDVYSALEPFNVSALGGRVTGIGVAGFTLGGGYAWKSNQHGLAVDNVVAYELVTPNGKIVNVTHDSDPQLFFGLKGGFNNFGIVTKFTVKAFPQTQVWGGVILSQESTIPAVSAATTKFQTEVKDPKAAIIIGYTYVAQLQQTLVSQILFYDAPTPPEGIFDDFLAIPAATTDISTRSFLSLVQSSPGVSGIPTRGMYEGISIVQATPEVLDTLVNETQFWGATLQNKTSLMLSYDVELFLPTLYSHNTEQTAYPPVRTIPFQPFNIAYSWNSSEFDSDFHEAILASAAHIRQKTIEQGQTQLENVPTYPNYAALGTPLQAMYGANIPALRQLKARVDPDNVMGLAGGWKF